MHIIIRAESCRVISRVENNNLIDTENLRKNFFVHDGGVLSRAAVLDSLQDERIIFERIESFHAESKFVRLAATVAADVGDSLVEENHRVNAAVVKAFELFVGGVSGSRARPSVSPSRSVKEFLRELNFLMVSNLFGDCASTHAARVNRGI